ncbi:MAG: DinB family protein [Bacteroidetes bacterium]|nr:DinB family protein [Bacteroidota bacterium]
MTRNHFVDLATFNAWANNKIFDFITLNINADLLDKEIVSSFPSVNKTIFHIWDAELIWLERLRGVSLKNFPSKTFTGSALEGLKKFIENTNQLLDTVSNSPEVFFEENISFSALSGESYTQEVSAILTHVINHSSFHRGQLIMMFRQLGFTEGIPDTDFIIYDREKHS